jgi:microsomal dipeptidase-like Zn-dependent dipeptidase
MRAVGVEHCILASDLGQAANPPPPEGFAAFIGALAKEGFDASDLEVMTKRNPARILGIE